MKEFHLQMVLVFKKWKLLLRSYVHSSFVRGYYVAKHKNS